MRHWRLKNGDIIMTEYPRGSEWAKWDLHIHTPESIVNSYGNSTDVWEKYLEDLEALSSDFKVLGINDYLFLDGYEKVKHEKEINDRLPNIELILPVVEFRIQKFAGVDFRSTKRINMHVIFSNELEIETIRSQFLNALEQSYTLTSGFDPELWNGSITKKSLEDLGNKIKASIPDDKLSAYGSDLIEGFNNLNLDEKQIFELLKRSYFKDKYLIAIGKTEWDQLKWTEGSITEKKSIINDAHLVFTSAESVEQYINAKQKLKDNEVNDLLLDCSDAHTFSHNDETKDRIGNCFNWIKANPTFEGLRQVIFERFERIRVQDNNPQKDYEKPFFSEININQTDIFNDSGVKFKETNLLLNPNLVTIIGGRGTGKSLLLDAIARTFNKVQKNERSRDVAIDNDNFIVNYQKSDGDNFKYYIQDENNLDYLHIHQGEVKEIVDPNNPDVLDDEIKKLLHLSSEEKILFFSIGKNLIDLSESKIERLINEIFEIKDWLNYGDIKGNQSNSFDFNIRKKKEKEDLIETITTEENRQLIDQYIRNLGEINKIKEQIKKAQQILGNFVHFQREKNAEIEKLNEHIDIEENKIPQLNLQTQIDSLNHFTHERDEQITELHKKNSEIDTIFKDAGIKTDITTLLEQIEIYQNEINAYDNKIKEIELKTEEINKKFAKLGMLADSILAFHQNYIQEIGDGWRQLKNGKENWNPEQKSLITELLNDIEIKALDVFNSNEFYNQISAYLNLGKFRETQLQTRNERFEETFQIKDQNDFIKLLKGEKIVNVDGTLLNLAETLDSDLFNKDGKREFLRILLLERNRKQYWNVKSSSTYKNKEIRQLSVGMRGTFYVCLKLATDPFVKPFVFDQPEDDLDNDFIMRSLVPIFKKIKKYRQVIIVTHNANLVVNADAEQVIVAINEGEVLSYESGSIENPAIRKPICDILEGGEPAFTMREKKYGFVKK
jgi:ABC-type cobalamin/Fe3+-siderophores transport system ATPase subunit